MKKVIIALLIILALSSALQAEVKIAALNLLHPGSVGEIVDDMGWLLMLEPELDIILGPAELLGGDSNKARIIFEDSSGVITFEPADDFERSREVCDLLGSICSLAAASEVTIIPGTLWEVDFNARCFEAAPIIGPDGLIRRVRRKAHHIVWDPFIDPGIHPDTIYTRDGSVYTYLLAICNESKDLPIIYGSPPLQADILLAANCHWMEGFCLAADEIRFSCPPDWSEISGMLTMSNFEGLADNEWVKPAAPMVVSSFGERAGAAMIGNFFSMLRPEGGWYDFRECSESPFGVIVTCDPDSPVVKRQLSLHIFISDSSGVPVESLRVSVRHVDRPVWQSSYSDSGGRVSFRTCKEGNFLLKYEAVNCEVHSCDTAVTLDYDIPAETLVVVVSIDTLTSICEKPVPENFGIKIYPNPFNGTIFIKIAQVEAFPETPVKLEIYDIAGRLVSMTSRDACPYNGYSNPGLNCSQSPASRALTYFWTPQTASSGIYLVKVVVGDVSMIRRVVYLK
ncbi:T9SS type A sorting domain-containing protein [bacterium]|nr:T9SS type A sorting domain-containing protein [bacterium]